MRAAALKTPQYSPQVPKPFLKWAGGKTQLLPEILARMPSSFRRYHEPFMGGGAVFFSLQPQQAVISDINPDLVNAYTVVRDDVEGLIKVLRRHRSEEDYFYRVRAQDVSKLSPTQAAARIIFLNRTCFNGLYRVNRKGQFNVPFGRYKNPLICNVDNLRAVSQTLQGTTIRNDNVFNISLRVRRRDVVYFDPPYDPISSTASFTSYAKDGFGREEQRRLADLFAQLAERGVHVILSNSDTPYIRQLYKGFKIDRVMARRAINSRADKRGKVAEVIVTAP
jgi:DNA adenine methylase